MRGRGGGNLGSLLNALLVSAAVVVVTLGLSVAFRHAMPDASAATVYAVSGAVAVVAVFGIHLLAASRFVWTGVEAVSDGLLSLTEADYGVRLAVVRDDEVGKLIRRFNTLAEAMRRDRSSGYQKQMLLETVLAASSTIAVIANEADRIIYANPSAELFLSSGKSLEGRQLHDLLADAPPELQEAVRVPHDVLFTCNRPGVDEPETFHLSKHYFEISTQKHTLFLLKPLTKELARKEVETWKKAIRVLSHEVNNSLAPITSLVHSARLMVANPGVHQARLGAALDTIQERAAHLKTFLDGYASFARLPLPSKRTLMWSDLLSGLEGLYPFTIEGELPRAPVYADPAQLQQVLINVLKNAAESGSPSAEVSMAFRLDDRGGVEVAVQDRGKGMSPDVLRNALVPFYSTKKTGSGLGLALCHEIVEAHGGRLSLHPREGGGLSVRLWLPAQPAAGENRPL